MVVFRNRGDVVMDPLFFLSLWVVVEASPPCIALEKKGTLNEVHGSTSLALLDSFLILNSKGHANRQVGK